MQRHRCRFCPETLLRAGLSALWLCLISLAVTGTLHASPQQTTLLLDVEINGAPANMICRFTLFPGGVIGTTRSELEQLGLQSSAVRAAGALVMLHDFPTLHYSYEERSQRIRITVDNRYRRVQTFDLHNGRDPAAPRAQSGIGAVLNYDVFALFGGTNATRPLGASAVSATLDGRIFSPFGTLSQSAIASLGSTSLPPLIRLDTSLRYSDPATLISAALGDTISGGLWWTRPIRIGGLQGQTNFSLRPDLVTMALPNIGGTAAVPSTVDVYVNSIHALTEQVNAGPYALTNIPMVTGAGNAEVVLRDATGHQTTSVIPFYGSAALLAPGLDSWSVEVGLPRLSYGSTDDRYPATPVGAATWRRGVLPWLTTEIHAEGGSGVVNGGGGGAIRIGSIGVASLAAAGSVFRGRSGGLGNAEFETTLWGLNLSLGSQHSLGDYEDLASATAELGTLALVQGAAALDDLSGNAARPRGRQGMLMYGSARVPLAFDRLTIGGRTPFDPSSSWGFSLVHQRDLAGDVAKLASVSYSRTLPWKVSLFATAFKDFGTAHSTGLLFGLSIPLGPSVTIAANLSTGAGAPTGSISAGQSLEPEPGSFGWQVQDTEGATQYRQGSIAYRSTLATLQAGVSQTRSSVGGTIEATGAVATMAGDIFMSNRINDAFAVVDAGAPDVPVFLENRPIGKTDSQGMLLVPGLRSYQRNRISIDPSNLPVDAEIENTRQLATPADRAGILVSMKHHKNLRAALLTFVRPDGSFVPAGSWGHLSGGGTFIIGYDGQSFIKSLAQVNHIEINLGRNKCVASFPFKPRPGRQVKIGPVICK
jgi:outer membrane usher protein